MVYVCGFTGLIALTAIVQAAKLAEDGEVAPQQAWKWFVLLAALWPFFLVLFVVAVPFATLVTKSDSQHSMTPGLQKKDYAFSVEARNEKWDVYYFTKNGKKGTIAVTRRRGKFVIGLFANGNLSEEEVASTLNIISRQQEA